MGNYYMPSPKYFILSVLLFKLLLDKSKENFLKFIGSYFIKNYKLFIFFPKWISNRPNVKSYKLLGSYAIPSAKCFITFYPRLFQFNSNVKLYKFLGRYFIPSLNYSIISSLSGKTF